MGRVSGGLVSMVRVLGALPIIRAPTGGAAEMLAQVRVRVRIRVKVKSNLNLTI
jgi:hypothetical protein